MHRGHPFTPCRRWSASTSPLRAWWGKSTCDVSPETTIFDPSPSRVRNIFIWPTVVFCASSMMMKALLSVRSAHVGERRHFDDVVLHVAANLLVIDHLPQRVLQRPQVGVDLGLHIARQEAEAFARFDRGADEDDLANRLIAEPLQRPWPRRDRSCRYRPGRRKSPGRACGSPCT